MKTSAKEKNLKVSQSKKIYYKYRNKDKIIDNRPYQKSYRWEDNGEASLMHWRKRTISIPNKNIFHKWQQNKNFLRQRLSEVNSFIAELIHQQQTCTTGKEFLCTKGKQYQVEIWLYMKEWRTLKIIRYICQYKRHSKTSFQKFLYKIIDSLK